MFFRQLDEAVCEHKLSEFAFLGCR